MNKTTDPRAPMDFIRARITEDLASGKHQHIATRFPPEPNGYLHLGHAKSICLNFGLAKEFGGTCNLRFDDTNPLRESQEFVDAMQDDIRWLGFQWDGKFFASDYFDKLYACAEELIEKGLAYVDGQSEEQIRVARGSLTAPGRDSPDRNRSVQENLDLLRTMKLGQYPDGKYVLRAKIDMASPNINMRDPVIYRIRHAAHHHTGDAWCVYPLYDFTHCISDALEGITHSLCTLEFEDHRPLYDWFLDNVTVACHPRQIEFSAVGVEYLVMSKRFYRKLIEDGQLLGWDDPRIPTIAGMRRRGYTAAAIRDFCDRIGVTKQPNNVEIALLEFCVRADLEETAPRAMAVLEPLRVVIDNFPVGSTEVLHAEWHQKRPELGSHERTFSRELFIEREDFEEVPPAGYKRLSIGADVRLRGAYVISCDSVERDPAGNVIALHCTHFPASKSGGVDTSGRKPKGVIHWVDASSAVSAEVRLFERLFNDPLPDPEHLEAALNANSLRVVTAKVEQSVARAAPGATFQFERQGYFVVDMKDSTPARPLFNRTVTLRDSWKPSVKG